MPLPPSLGGAGLDASGPHSYALSLAKAEAAILLAGDAAMRQLAAAEG